MSSASPSGRGRAVALTAALLGLAALASAGPPDYGPERAAMVARLQAQKPLISNRLVLTAMAKVPRHLFVDGAARAQAYEEVDIPFGDGQVLCRPHVAALMAQALDPRPGSKILEVGTGSGYLSAVLAEITPHVYTVEMQPHLAKAAEARLRSLNYRSVRSRTGRGCQGWADHAPFDGIVVNCAAEQTPDVLIAQLREGGRLVIPIGVGPEQTLNCMRKSDGRLRAETVIATRVSPMLCRRTR